MHAFPSKNHCPSSKNQIDQRRHTQPPKSLNDMINYARALEKKGYCVLPAPNDYDLSALRNEFISTMRAFPEFKSPPSDGIYVLGGFAALGNPASFHNPFVRKIRQWQLALAMKHVFSDERYEGYNIEKLFDRMLARKPGLSASKESWHRDESPNALVSDKIYGGWTNFGTEAEFFSCVPFTHKSARGHSGFAKISKARQRELSLARVNVMIPPGAQIIFHEHIIHEVRASKDRHWHLRVHCGLRLTKSHLPMNPALNYTLDNQAVPPLKSMQTPPMYAALHWTNWRDKLERFSERFVNQAKEVRVVKSGARAGEAYHVVQRHLGSLADMGLPMYAPYTPMEREIFKPADTHILLRPGTEEYDFFYMPRKNSGILGKRYFNEGRARVRPPPLKRARVAF